MFLSQTNTQSYKVNYHNNGHHRRYLQELELASLQLLCAFLQAFSLRLSELLKTQGCYSHRTDDLNMCLWLSGERNKKAQPKNKIRCWRKVFHQCNKKMVELSSSSRRKEIRCSYLWWVFPPSFQFFVFPPFPQPELSQLQKENRGKRESSKQSSASFFSRVHV